MWIRSEEGPEVAKLDGAGGSGAGAAGLEMKIDGRTVLQKLGRALAQNGGFGFAGMQKLLPEKEFQTIFRSVIEKQWLLQPEELKQEHKVSGLYERLEQQLSQMEGGGSGDRKHAEYVLQTASQVHGNLEFMNQMNQIYHYAQIAVKDVRTKCERGTRCLCEPEESARSGCGTDGILHLDMERSAPRTSQCGCRTAAYAPIFYLEDDASWRSGGKAPGSAEQAS